MREPEAIRAALCSSALNATHEILTRLQARESIDVLELVLERLFVHNSHIFETTVFLLDRRYLVGADVLLRVLFEGTVMLEWCLVDPADRGLRYSRNVARGLVDLIENGFLSRPAEFEEVLRRTVDNKEMVPLKEMPNLRQMLQSLDFYKHGYAYNIYRYLSKVQHGFSVNQGDYIAFDGDRLLVCPIADPPEARLDTCRALAAFLQVRNVELVSEFDDAIRHPKL